MGEKEKLYNSPIPLSQSGCLLYACVTIFLPIVSFVCANFLGPSWASGRPSDYTRLMLVGPVSQVFYPSLAYSMGCMFLLLVSPRRFARYFVIRFGIYTGVVLSLQYTIIFGISFWELEQILDIQTLLVIVCNVLVCAIPIGIKRLYEKSRQKLGAKRTWLIIVGTTTCLWAIITIGTSGDAFLPYLLLLFLLFASAPAWCFAIALAVSIRLFKQYETERLRRGWRGLWLVAWIASYVAAWRVAIPCALEIYALLPKTPPPADCYIATAAARGHPQIVKSQPVAAGDGSLVWVNSQTRYLKCMELALMTISPRMHEWFRKIYDTLGTSLAHTLTHVVLADVAYVLLKPPEWCARGIMKMLVPTIDEIASQIYTPRSQQNKDGELALTVWDDDDTPQAGNQHRKWAQLDARN